MTYTHNPIGVVVLSSENVDHDMARWQAAKPHAMTFTQNTFYLVKRCLDGIPELQVAILRTVLNGEEEKELHKTGARGAENMVNAFIALCNHEGLDRNRCYLQLWNEPNLNSEREVKLDWTVYAMRLARERGVRVSALGVGMATLHADDWASGDFDQLLHECSDGYHVLNTHSYGSIILPAGAAGRYPDMYLNKDMAQQANWPSPYDVQEGSRAGNWYIGREFDIIARCNILGIPYPRIIIGECGIDRLLDLEKAKLSTGQIVNIYDTLEQRYARVDVQDEKPVFLKVPWPHWGMRGWHTVQWVHEDYYPDWLPAKTYVEMLKWMCWVYDNQVAEGRPYIESVQVFAHCPGMPDWATAWGMDISDSDHWYALVAEYGDGILNPPGPSPDPPALPPDDTTLPTAPGWLFALMLFVCACVILALLYTFTIAPRAQEVTVMEGIMPVQEAANLLMAWFVAIGVSGMASPLTEPLVNLAKLILKAVGQEKLISGNGINLLVSIGIVVIIWIAKHLGVELQTQSVFDWLVDFIPWVISGLTFFVGHKYVYQKAQALNLPLWKYQRTP